MPSANLAAGSARRVLVTGGAGFIGSHVADAFLAGGWEVLVIDDLSHGSERNVPAAAAFERIDIVEELAVARAFSAFRPTAVCHLAAQASVTASVDLPEHDLAVNVQGTFNVLQAARTAGAPVVFASTGGALYGEGAPIPSPETVWPEPLSPYGASKLAAEAYVGTWGRLHRIPNVVLRLANVYGPRQNPHGEAGVVAIFSERLRQGLAPLVYGDGRQTRDYVYVDDVAGAFLLAAESGQAATFNVGRGQESSVLELLEVLQGAAQTSLAPSFAPPRTGELARSALDSTRLRTALGWEPRVGLQEGLLATYRSYLGAEALDAADPA
jgi:UDP-glucose 4-epimerase